MNNSFSREAPDEKNVEPTCWIATEFYILAKRFQAELHERNDAKSNH